MSSPSSMPAAENLETKVVQQQAQIRWLELRIKDLETQLFGRKSEQRRGPGKENTLEWTELLAQVQALAPVRPTEPAPPDRAAWGPWPARFL